MNEVTNQLCNTTGLYLQLRERDQNVCHGPIKYLTVMLKRNIVGEKNFMLTIR